MTLGHTPIPAKFRIGRRVRSIPKDYSSEIKEYSEGTIIGISKQHNDCLSIEFDGVPGRYDYYHEFLELISEAGVDPELDAISYKVSGEPKKGSMKVGKTYITPV